MVTRILALKSVFMNWSPFMFTKVRCLFYPVCSKFRKLNYNKKAYSELLH